MEQHGLSLAGQVLLLSIDPTSGGLLVRKRRLKRALTAAGSSYADASSELEDAGMATGGRRPRLVDNGPATARFRALQEAIREGSFDDVEVAELLLLLAWTGVLAKRLSPDDRRRAARRLRNMGPLLSETAPRDGEPMTVSPLITTLVRAESRGSGDSNGLFDSGGVYDSGSGGGDFGGGGGGDGGGGSH